MNSSTAWTGGTRLSELTENDTEYQFSTTPSRKGERLDSERRILKELLEDAEPYLEHGKPYYKAWVQMLWCEAAGANARQFRRRLAEMPEELRNVYDRFLDGRQK